jgi:hypothetical protein
MRFKFAVGGVYYKHGRDSTMPRNFAKRAEDGLFAKRTARSDLDSKRLFAAVWIFLLKIKKLNQLNT